MSKYNCFYHSMGAGPLSYPTNEETGFESLGKTRMQAQVFRQMLAPSSPKVSAVPREVTSTGAGRERPSGP